MAQDTKFKKGQVPWNKGIKKFRGEYKLSEEQKKKIGLANSIALKGKKQSPESIAKRVLKLRGKKRTEEVKQRISLAHKGMKKPWVKPFIHYKGEKHWNWKGGISENLYSKEFTPTLKLKIRTRDNFTCQLCAMTEKEELEKLNRVLCVNHIDFDKNNCKENNLNTLCIRCNVKINRKREYWTKYFQQIQQPAVSATA